MNIRIRKILLVPTAMALLLTLAVAGCENVAAVTGTDNSANTSANDETGSFTADMATDDAGDSIAVSSNGGQAVEIVYKNMQYGFDFTLPESWNGYTIVTDKWEGVTNDEQGEVVVQTGPEIFIRHPLWTEAEPRQDIPIMVFTLEQWGSLQNEEYHIGAAPIGPRELGRNSTYVFALPARYNFAFLTGYEEVETILDNNPLQPTENFSD